MQAHHFKCKIHHFSYQTPGSPLHHPNSRPHRGLDTKLVILNTNFVILNTKFVILNTKFVILNTKFVILNTKIHLDTEARGSRCRLRINKQYGTCKRAMPMCAGYDFLPRCVKWSSAPERYPNELSKPREQGKYSGR